MAKLVSKANDIANALRAAFNDVMLFNQANNSYLVYWKLQLKNNSTL